MTAPPDPISSLSPARRALLERKIATRRAPLPETGIPRRPHPERACLTSGQVGLWFLDQLHTGSDAYACCVAYQLRGPLDVAALQVTLDALVARHEALRTTIQLDGELPVQAIARLGSLPLRHEHLDEGAEAARAHQAMQRLGAAAQRPFDLARGPLARATLLRLGAEEHILVLSMHHIIIDGFSLELLEREISVVYSQLAQGEAPSLPPQPLQFGDCAEWLEVRLRADLERLVAFWREYLDGLTGFLDLAAGDPDVPGPGQTVDVAFDATLLSKLRMLGHRYAATTCMTVMSSWFLLLSAVSEKDDLVIGTPVAARSRLELESVVGLFTNVVPVRAHVDRALPFTEFLSSVKASALRAMAHQDLPFARLVEALQPPRQPGRNPIFQAVFRHYPKRARPLCMHGLEVERVTKPPETARFDLMLSVTELPDAARCVIEYDSHRLDADWAVRQARRLTRLLTAIVDEPNAPLDELLRRSG